MDGVAVTAAARAPGDGSASAPPLPRGSVTPPPAPPSPAPPHATGLVGLPTSSTAPVNPLVQAMADIQQQLYRAQGDAARARTHIATLKEELAATQQRLRASQADVSATQAERDDARDRLQRCQDRLETARRDAADSALRSVTLTAERDDLSDKVHEAWEKIASLRQQLSEAEARQAATTSSSQVPPSGAAEDGVVALLADTYKAQLTQAHEELAVLRERCEKVERERSSDEHQQHRTSVALVDALAAVADTLEKLRGVYVRRLLPLDAVARFSSNSSSNSMAEVDQRDAVSTLEELDSRVKAPGAAALAPCKPIVRAMRALLHSLDAVYEDAVRLGAARAEDAKESERAKSRAQRIQAEVDHLQREVARLQSALAEQQQARGALVASTEKESAAMCRSLAATLNCIEDWAMVRHRVQYLQQQSVQWEGEVKSARQQLAVVRADAESALQRQATELKGERVALNDANRRLQRELAALRDEHAALRLEHEYSTASAQATAAVAGNDAQLRAVSAELNKLRHEHATLQSAYAEALRCMEEELEPFAEEQERRARAAKAQVDRLAGDKEKLYGIVEVLRAQLKARRADGGGVAHSADGTDSDTARERVRSPPPPADQRRAAVDDGGVSSTDASHMDGGGSSAARRRQATARKTERAALHAAPVATSPPRGHAPPPPPAAMSAPYPPPVLSTPSALAGAHTRESDGPCRDVDVTAVRPEEEASPTAAESEETLRRRDAEQRLQESRLHASLQEDRRAAAYRLGRSIPLGSSSGGGNDVPHRPSPPLPTSNKFASEVLGVIEALDRRVTGALHQRRGQADD